MNKCKSHCELAALENLVFPELRPLDEMSMTELVTLEELAELGQPIKGPSEQSPADS